MKLYRFLSFLAIIGFWQLHAEAQEVTGLDLVPEGNFINASWDDVSASSYAIYVSPSAFNNTQGMIPNKQVNGSVSTKISGLDIGVLYYFSVVSLPHNDEDSLQPVSLLFEGDTQGPEFKQFISNTFSVDSSTVLTIGSTLSVGVEDASGVSGVSVLSASGQKNISSDDAGMFSFVIDESFQGNNEFSFVAEDTLGNKTEYKLSVSAVQAPVQTFGIKSPVTGYESSQSWVSLTLESSFSSNYYLEVNGSAASPVMTLNGQKNYRLELFSDNNSIVLVSVDDSGSELSRSAVVNVSVNENLPETPAFLTAKSLSSGRVQLRWSSAENEVWIYRSSSQNLAQAGELIDKVVSAQEYVDVPATEGSLYYGVRSVNAYGSSDFSEIVTATIDSTGPEVQSISYEPEKSFDGKAGTGKMKVSFSLSEAVSGSPYFALVSSGRSPVVIPVSSTGFNEFSGIVDVSAERFSSGQLFPLFSATDLVGNRGTVINSELLEVDVDGPSVGDVQPGKTLYFNNSLNEQGVQDTLEVSVLFTELVDASAEPSGVLVNIQSGEILTGSERALIEDNGRWIYRTEFESSAGSESQAYELQISARDMVGNTGLSPAAQIQVYQGDIPPPTVPTGLSVSAQPSGGVLLNWNTVEAASGYEVWRAAAGADFSLISTDSIATSFSETLSSGAYDYKLRSYRDNAGQRSYSAFSAPVAVNAATALTGVTLTGSAVLQGTSIVLEWQDTGGRSDLVYRVERSVQEAPAVVIHNQLAMQTYTDYTPKANTIYFITALDVAGNESSVLELASPVDNSAPLAALNLKRNVQGIPELSWEYDQADSFNVYRYLDGEADGQWSVAGELREYIDSSLPVPTSWSRSYSYKVTAVVNQQESAGVSLLLPRFEVTSITGSVRRGIFNKLQAEVKNLSASDYSALELTASFTYPEGEYSFSEKLQPLSAGDSQIIDIVIPGYSSLEDTMEISVSLAGSASPAAKALSQQTITAQVTDDTLSAQLSFDEIQRGGITNLSLSLDNPADVNSYLVFAESDLSGFKASRDIFTLVKDAQGNLLDRKSVKLISGDHLVQRGNQVVLDLPAHQAVTIDNIPLYVDPAWPDDIRIEMVAERQYMRQSEDNILSVSGFTASVDAVAQSAPYSADIVSVTPASIYADGESFVTIAGRVLGSSSPVGLPVDIILTVDGFEKKLQANAAEDGTFNVVFTPRRGETGIYKISAIYPGLAARPASASLSVIGAGVSPAEKSILLGRNFKYELGLAVTAHKNTSLTNIRVETDTNSPLYVESESIAAIAPGETRTLQLKLASNQLGSGNQLIRVVADGFEHPIGTTQLNYTVTDAKPSLVASPSYLSSAARVGEAMLDTITVENQGLADLLNPEVSLQWFNDGVWGDAPGWLKATADIPNQRILLGESAKINLYAYTDSVTDVGDYQLRLQVSGDNSNVQSFPVFFKITQAGSGALNFYIADNYTGTTDSLGQVYGGVANAAVKIQNVDVLSDIYDGVTATDGSLTLSDIPAGKYYYEVTAFDHQRIAGEITVKPGITTPLNLLSPVNTVSVSFDVVETTVADEYKVQLNNKFETDVPAAIVVFEPTMIEVPVLKKGEVFTGELTMVNHGLLKAYGLRPELPETNEYARYEFMGEFPSTLDAGASYTIAYKITALSDFDSYNSGLATGAASEPWLNIGDINVSGFYYCLSGIVIFVAPDCLFVIPSFSFTFGGQIFMSGVDLGGGRFSTVQNPDGSTTTSNGTVSIKISSGGSSSGGASSGSSSSGGSSSGGSSSGGSSSGGSSSGSTTSGSRENLGDRVGGSSGTGGSGSSGGGTSGSPAVSEPLYEGTSYKIKIDNSYLSSCRKMTARGISIAVGSAFSGCEH